MTMEKKYRLLEDETITIDGRTLYRIEALRDFADVNKGDKGGYIESEINLSHEGNCWVSGNAWVCDKALVSGNARVFGNAWIYGYAWVAGNAVVAGYTRIYEGEFTSGK